MAMTVQDLLSEITRVRRVDGAADTYAFSLHEILAIYFYLDENLQLRAERVKLQGENESLRHDLAESGKLLDSALDTINTLRDCGPIPADNPALKDSDYARQLDEMAETLRPVKTEADIAALFERLAKVEDRVSAVVRDHDAYIQQVLRGVHKRIDALFAEAQAADKANGGLLDRLQVRVGALEQLAETRGTRLDSLEERQHQDDLDRAAGEGMPEAPTRFNVEVGDRGGLVYERVPMEETLSSISAAHVDEESGDSTFVVRPTHENGKQAGGPRLRVATNPGKDYGVGDWVKVGPCRSMGDHRDIEAGWYPVLGIDNGVSSGRQQVQINLDKLTGAQATIPNLVWVSDRGVIDASPTKPEGDL